MSCRIIALCSEAEGSPARATSSTLGSCAASHPELVDRFADRRIDAAGGGRVELATRPSPVTLQSPDQMTAYQGLSERV